MELVERKRALGGRGHGLVQVVPVLERYGRFRGFLGTEENDAAIFRALRQSETTGRPLKAQKRGPKKIQIRNI